MTEPILLAQPASDDGPSTMSPAFSGSLQDIEEDLAIMRRIVEDHAQAPISDRIAISDIQSCERYLEWFNDNSSLSKNVRTLFFYGAPQNSGLELWLASPKGLQLASYLSQATDVEFYSTHFEYLYASHNPLDMFPTTFFSFLPAVSTIKLHCCSFPAFEDMAALLASFRSPVKNLSLSGISWVEPSKKHAVAFYDMPSLEHLSVEAFDDMAFLSTWLMCSDIISQIRTLEICVSDDLGTLIAARLLSVGCAKLETLLISVVMGSALNEDLLSIRLTHMTSLQTLIVLDVEDQTCTLLPYLVSTLPQGSPLATIGFSHSLSGSWHTQWLPVLANLDQLFSQQRLPLLGWVGIAPSHASSLDDVQADMARIMNSTYEQGILHFLVSPSNLCIL